MPDSLPLWQQRFRAPILGFPTWSRHAPDRLVFVSSESGTYQLHSWYVATGVRRQITSEPVGLVSGNVSADGEWVPWHRDVTGDESGRWMVAPILQAYDRALLGGTPSEVPQLMAERSPISYVDNVTAPVLVLAGANDSRCPIAQVLAYTDRLAVRGHPHELYLFPTGHAPYQIDERIHQTGVVLEFLARHVPGIHVPS